MSGTDPRFTLGLVCEVFDVLEAHGYRRGDSHHVGQAFALLLPLVRVYEGQDEADLPPDPGPVTP